MTPQAEFHDAMSAYPVLSVLYGTECVREFVGAQASTHVPLMSRVREHGFLGLHKVFITDRSNLPRVISMAHSSKADVLQLQPAPVLDRLRHDELRALGTFVAGGFVASTEDAHRALRLGAVAFATRTPALWSGLAHT